MRVLLVEDDDRVTAALGDVLRRHGVLVQRVATGQAALAAHRADLVLLDLGLPDMDGLAVCRALRRVVDVPIIAVTARAEEHERIAGLRAGADDYVVKPYSSAELLARMEAVLRRSHRAGAGGAQAPVLAAEPAVPVPVIRLGALEIDPDARRATLSGAELKLSRKEFDLLAVLAGAQGAVCAREALLDRVWGATLFGSTRTLDVHVATLRAKLGDPDLVETVRGVGYRMRSAVPLP